MEPRDNDTSDLLLECFMNWAEVLKNIDKKP